MYKAQLGDIMRHQGVSSINMLTTHKCTACAFKTSDAGDLDENKLYLEAFFSSVNAWMLHNNLHLNDDKTKIRIGLLPPGLSASS